MRRLLTVVAGAMLLAGCQSDRVTNVTPVSVSGIWVKASGVPGSGLTIQLDATTTAISGAGTYQIEAGKSGRVSVSGTVQSGVVKLDLVFDDQTQAHFSGTLEGTTMLSGALKYGPANGDQPSLSVTFQKSMDDMGMGMGMMMEM